VTISEPGKYVFNVHALVGRQTITGPPVSTTVKVGEAHLSMTPSSVQFGTAWAGLVRSARVEVANTGTAGIELGSMSISGADRSAFAVRDDRCSRETLLPSESCRFTVDFRPAWGGDFAATLVAGGTTGAATASLHGTSDQGFLGRWHGTFTSILPGGRTSAAALRIEPTSVTGTIIFIDGWLTLTHNRGSIVSRLPMDGWGIPASSFFFRRTAPDPRCFIALGAGGIPGSPGDTVSTERIRGTYTLAMDCPGGPDRGTFDIFRRP
jgi:hypothetical protein